MNYYTTCKPLIQNASYDEQNALSLATACHLAYQKDEHAIAATINSWQYQLQGFMSVVKGSDIDTQCYVMSDEDNIVVVFRGTDSVQDWFANLQASYAPGPFTDTKVHAGFQQALFPVVLAITSLLAQAALASKKLWITGHSLGGALASLYAGMLLENGYNVYGLYTFASPRVGDSAFATQLNEQISGPHYRVINCGDIVPHVPPEPFYSHAGKRIIIKETHKDNREDSWFAQRSDALQQFAKGSVDMLDIADNHHLSADDESYIPRLMEDFKRTVKL